MNQGKFDVIKREMESTRTEILGINELRWTGLGQFQSDDYKVFLYGHEACKRNGVAVICNNEMAGSVLESNQSMIG